MSGKFAIVTGASTGIGRELAHCAAREGYDLLIVADEREIEAAAQELRRHGGEVEAVQADLATFEGVDQLLHAGGGRPVDVLCANAGCGLGHAFLGQDPAGWRRVVDTNITGTIYLLQQVLRDMVARDCGKVLITGSIAGFIPGSFQAVYSGTKAFIDSFADAIRDEIKKVAKHVTITNLMPGPVETPFFARADMLDTRMGQLDSKSHPADVAQVGWKALMNGDAHIIPGWTKKLQVAAARVTPGPVLARLNRKMAEPDSAR
jgi:uncharacterized protein